MPIKGNKYILFCFKKDQNNLKLNFCQPFRFANPDYLLFFINVSLWFFFILVGGNEYINNNKNVLQIILSLWTLIIKSPDPVGSHWELWSPIDFSPSHIGVFFYENQNGDFFNIFSKTKNVSIYQLSFSSTFTVYYFWTHKC